VRRGEEEGERKRGRGTVSVFFWWKKKVL